MNIYPFKSLYPDLSLIMSTDTFFSSVKEKFSEFRNNGFYIEHDVECFFIYEVTSPRGHFKGLLVANDLEDIKSLRIKPHEKTLASKEQNMIEFTLERKAFIKPLLVGYDSVAEIDDLLSVSNEDSPFFTFELEEAKEKHIVWIIENKKLISAIQKAFKNQVNNAYIADGHHRCSTALLINENRALIQHMEQPLRMLTLYLPFKDLKIYDYNRIIRLKEETSKIEFIIQLSKLAKLKPCKNKSKPKKKFDFHLYLDSGWYICKWKSKVLKKYSAFSPILDITIFNQEMINSILHYEDFEMDYLVEYVSGTVSIDEFENKVNKEDHAFGVYLFPVTIPELKAIADDNKTFPPKSTWFEPRVINGIINIELK